MKPQSHRNRRTKYSWMLTKRNRLYNNCHWMMAVTRTTAAVTKMTRMNFCLKRETMSTCPSETTFSKSSKRLMSQCGGATKLTMAARSLISNRSKEKGLSRSAEGTLLAVPASTMNRNWALVATIRQMWLIRVVSSKNLHLAGARVTSSPTKGLRQRRPATSLSNTAAKLNKVRSQRATKLATESVKTCLNRPERVC